MTPKRFEEIKKLIAELSGANHQGSPIPFESHRDLLRAAGELVDQIQIMAPPGSSPIQMEGKVVGYISDAAVRDSAKGMVWSVSISETSANVHTFMSRPNETQTKS
jgi:hypothetical protein